MKQLKYGFYGEDDAHKIFLHNYLGHFADQQSFLNAIMPFVRSLERIQKKQVDSKFAGVVSAGFAWYQHDVFFVVRDVDSITS